MRRILRKPLRFGAIIIVLGVGVAVCSTVFSLITSVFLTPLPYSDPSSLVVIWEQEREKRVSKILVAPADYLDIESTKDLFTCASAYDDARANLVGLDRPMGVQLRLATTNLFECLGVQPVHGRQLDENDHDGLLISESLWARLGRRPSVIGRQLALVRRGQRSSHQVIGVVPDLPLPGARVDVWAHLPLGPEEKNDRTIRNLIVLARMASGDSLESVRSKAQLLAGRLAEAYPETNSEYGFHILRLSDELFGEFRSPLLLLQAASGLLLLIVCANVANLFLLRGLERYREINVRLALGATGAQIRAGILVEPFLLGAFSGLLAAGLTVTARSLLQSNISSYLGRSIHPEADWTVLGFAITAGCLSGLLSAVPSVLTLSRATMTEPSRAVSSGRHGRRISEALVAAEIALVVVLSVSSLLLFRSFLNLTAVDFGFESQGVLLFDLSLQSERYSSVQEGRSLMGRLVELVRAVPGVRSAAVSDDTNITGTDQGPIEIADRGLTEQVSFKSASDSYFHTLGISLRSGRAFNTDDRENAQPVVIINQELARRYWPEGNAIGQRIKFFRERLIVGVVENVRSQGREREIMPEIYLPYLQHPFSPGGVILVKSDAAADRVSAAIEEVVQGVDPELPFAVRSLEAMVADTSRGRLAPALAWSFFAVFALFLVALGTYAVVSRGVEQRAHEIGIRMAVGAPPLAIISEVFRRQGILLAIGIPVGIGGALAMQEILSHLLFGIDSIDPISILLGIAAVVGATLIATLRPAVRAARLDPVIVLRVE